ncbi:MAG: hypothetical protein AB1498_12045 [bacterium]
MPVEMPVFNEVQEKENKKDLIEKYKILIKEIQNTRIEKEKVIELINMDTDKRKSDEENKKIAYAKNRVKYIDEVYITQLEELKDTAKKLRYLNYPAKVKISLGKYGEAQNELELSRDKLDSIKNKIKSFLTEYWSEKADEKQAIAAVNEAKSIQKEYDVLVKIIKITEKELEVMEKEYKNTDYLKEYLSESKKLLEEYEEIKREAIISKNRLDSVNKEKDIKNEYDALIKMIKITEKELRENDHSQGKTKPLDFKTAIDEKEKKLLEYYEELQKEILTPKNKLDEIRRTIDIYTAKERVASIRGNYKEVDEYRIMAEKTGSEAKKSQKEYDALLRKINKIEKELRNKEYLKEILSEAKMLYGKYEKAENENEIARDKLNKLNEQTNIDLSYRASMVKSWSELMDKYEGKGEADKEEIENIRNRYYVSAKELKILEKELGDMGYPGKMLSRPDIKKLIEIYRDIRKEVKAVKNEMDGINRQINIYLSGQGAAEIQPDPEKDKVEAIKNSAKDLQEKYDGRVKEFWKIKKELSSSGLSPEDKNILERWMAAEEDKVRLLESSKRIQNEIKTLKNKMDEINEKINFYAAKERAVVIRKDQENADEYKEEKEFFISQGKCIQEEYDKLAEKIKPIEIKLEIIERIIRAIEKKLGYQDGKSTKFGTTEFLERYKMVLKEIKVTGDELGRTSRQIYVYSPGQGAEDIKKSLEKDKVQIEVIKKTAEGLQERYNDLSKELWEIKKELGYSDCLRINENILEMEITEEEKNERLFEIYEGFQSEMKASEEERYQLDIIQAEGMIYSDLQRTAKYGNNPESAEEYKRKAKAARAEKRWLQRKYDNLKKELEIIKKEFQ